MLVRELTEGDKREICGWDYQGEYAIYNLPSYEEMEAKEQGFLNPRQEKNYRGFFEDDTLVGFVNLLEKPTEIFLGVGVCPALCGKGYGQEIVRQAYGLSKELHPTKPLYLEVRFWNTRAIRCYERAGFRIDGEPFERITSIGKGRFYRMVRA